MKIGPLMLGDIGGCPTTKPISSLGQLFAEFLSGPKELDKQKRRLKTLYAEERLRAEIVKAALEKSMMRNKPDCTVFMQIRLTAGFHI